MERKLTTTRLADGKFEKKGEEEREGRKEKKRAVIARRKRVKGSVWRRKARGVAEDGERLGGGKRK